MSVLPVAWREKLTDIYLAEVLTAIIALGSAGFGAVVVAYPAEMMQAPSFRQAFTWAPPHVWGLPMVVLGVVTAALLLHSRLAAAPPATLLAIFWVLWFIPLVQTHGFVPTAPVVFAIIAAITMTAAWACLVPRRKG